MKIAILSTIYPFRGGIAQFNANMYHAFAISTELNGQKNEVKAFTFIRQYPSLLYPGESQYVKPGDKVEIVPSIPVLDTVGPFSYITAAHQINLYHPDVLIMKYWLPFFGPSLGTVAKLMRKDTKVITILDNVLPHETRIFDHTFTKYFLNQNDGFITMSDKVKDDLLSFIPDAKYKIYPHPLYDHFGAATEKNQARKELNLPTDKKLLLYFGYIRDYKGLDILIETISQLPEDYHLILAGESYGDFTPYLELIAKFQVKDKITLLNRYIPDREVSLLFSAADVCVLSYKSATQSGVTSIALHYELPLVVTNVGGLKEMVEHEKTGLVAERAEPELVKEQLINYFTKYDIQSFRNNIKKMKEELSWKRFTEKIIDFSKEL